MSVQVYSNSPAMTADPFEMCSLPLRISPQYMHRGIPTTRALQYANTALLTSSAVTMYPLTTASRTTRAKSLVTADTTIHPTDKVVFLSKRANGHR